MEQSSLPNQEQKPVDLSSSELSPPLDKSTPPANGVPHDAPADKQGEAAIPNATHHTPPTGKTNEIEPLSMEERIARWGEVTIEDDDEVLLYLPDQTVTLLLDLKPDGQILLGRPRHLKPEELQGHPLPETTIPIMTPADRKKLLARLKQERELKDGEVEDEQEHKDTPWLDLEPYQGEELGVSRKHALIERQHRLLYITDLDSKNGTRINGDLLAPRHRRIIRNGDEVRLGRLTLTIQIKEKTSLAPPPESVPSSPPTNAPADTPPESGQEAHPSKSV
jgi:hypothetical protein